MDCAAQGMFVFAAELSPYAQQKENSRYLQLEVILGGEKGQQKTTLWGKEGRLLPCFLSPHINNTDRIFSGPHTTQTISPTI